MAFGNSVTDFTIMAPGATGNVIALSLVANRLRKISTVQLQAVSGTYSEVSDTPVTYKDVFSYLQDAAAPTFAWAQTDNTLYLFLRSDTYDASSANTRLGLFFWRNTYPLVDLTTKLDIKQEKKLLWIGYVNRIARRLVGGIADIFITNEIAIQKAKLSYLN